MALTSAGVDRLTALPSPAPGLLLWALRLDPRDTDEEIGRPSAADRERLASFAPVHAGRLLARRALQRTAVAAVGDCPPGAVRVLADEGPRRVAVPGGAGWYVSVSACGDRGLLALADTPVGVDLEATPGPPDALAVSRHFCAPAEHDWISAPGADEADRFLRIWVRKEAVVKCTGEGLAAARLQHFVVDGAAPSAPVVTLDGAPLGIDTYTVALPGFVAAAALADASR